MKKKFTYILLPVLLINFCSRLQAVSPEKDPPSDFHAQFDMAFVLGAQVYNDNFLYNPGLAFLGAYGKQVNKKVFLGLGTGVMALQDVVFVPLFIDFSGTRGGKVASSLVNIQAGYAPGFDRHRPIFTNSHMNGGLYMGAGIGQQFRLGNQFSLALILAYRHQFATIGYQVAEGHHYSEKLHFDMLSLGIRIIL